VKSFAATDSRVRPIVASTVPMTTGGKNRMNFAKYGAARKVKMPEMMIEP